MELSEVLQGLEVSQMELGTWEHEEDLEGLKGGCVGTPRGWETGAVSSAGRGRLAGREGKAPAVSFPGLAGPTASSPFTCPSVVIPFLSGRGERRAVRCCSQ